MSILDGIPGANQKVIDYACAGLGKSSAGKSRARLHGHLSRIQRDCRRIIMTETSITDQQKLQILQRIDDELEALGL